MGRRGLGDVGSPCTGHHIRSRNRAIRLLSAIDETSDDNAARKGCRSLREHDSPWPSSL